ncbi:MAG: DRTGG domain-containing protein [Eubacteriales bacterium]|nr:DRTGG domain-containing protein [Eubacteriales bacterium]
MTISDIVSILEARILCGEDKLSTEVYSACCSDLMSDVLAFVNEKTVLLTGLTNMHVLRTAEILDLKCLIFARGKIPNDDIIARADQMNLVVLTANKTMFTCAGLLYDGGLRGAAMAWKEEDKL